MPSTSHPIPAQSSAIESSPADHSIPHLPNDRTIARYESFLVAHNMTSTLLHIAFVIRQPGSLQLYIIEPLPKLTLSPTRLTPDVRKKMPEEEDPRTPSLESPPRSDVNKIEPGTFHEIAGFSSIVYHQTASITLSIDFFSTDAGDRPASISKTCSYRCIH